MAVQPATYYAEVVYDETNLFFHHTVWLYELERGTTFGKIVTHRSFRTREKALAKAREMIDTAQAFNDQAVTVRVQ